MTRQDGTPYYYILFNLIMTIRSGDVHFELQFQGKNYGTAKAKYAHDWTGFGQRGSRIKFDIQGN